MMQINITLQICPNILLSSVATKTTLDTSDERAELPGELAELRWDLLVDPPTTPRDRHAAVRHRRQPARSLHTSAWKGPEVIYSGSRLLQPTSLQHLTF